MEVNKTNLRDVLTFKPFIHEDFRGQFIELYKEDSYLKSIETLTGKKINFIEDCMSTSFKGVLRGIHGDNETWKLINVLKGSAYAVVVNCDKEDDNFGVWESFTLSEKNRLQVLVPPKFGTAHLVLSDEVLWHYKFSTHYNPEKISQFSYRFDDPRFNIWWPIKNPVLSQRDEWGDKKLK